jgi:hypothetical protein
MPDKSTIELTVENTICELLENRRAGGSICPSEAARQLWPREWREHMPQVRAVAFDMADRHALEVTQQGKIVGRDVRGPIRLRLAK